MGRSTITNSKSISSSINSKNNSITAMEQKTAFHMKVENESESEMELCGRCHLPTHKTKACPEFGTLSCPRCLEWGHWEDACWTQDGEPHVCSRCNYEGHTEAVHDAEDFKQGSLEPS